MAINVNTVYTTVLSILNKEQRGYLTPYEFNKAATQSQLDIFEKYFTDLDAQLRIPQNEFDYSNPIKNIDDELSTFKCFGDLAFTLAIPNNFFTLPTVDNLTGKTIVYNDQPSSSQFAFYRLGTVNYGDPGNFNPPLKPIEIERLQRDPFYNIDRSDLTAPSENYPVYLYESKKVWVKPNSIQTQVQASFIRKPVNPVWGFTVNSVGAYIYDPTVNVSVDFEISSNDQTELILQILQYAGVVIRDPQIVQVASQELAQE